MSKSFKQITSDVSKAWKPCTKRCLTLKGFSAMARAALASGTIDALHKELIALAIGVSSRCDACIGYHIRPSSRLRHDPRTTDGNARHLRLHGRRANLMYAAEAVRAYDEMLPKNV